jgi:hypothetical protein
MDSILLQLPDGNFESWHYRPLNELGLGEIALETAILAQPASLVLDPLNVLHGKVAVYDQRHFQSGSGQRSIPDVILLTDHGDVMVVEVKRLGNRELRGRDVVSQVVDYAATLSEADEDVLVKALSRGECSSWGELCDRDFPNARKRTLARAFKSKVENADLHLVVACDRAPARLAEWIRAAGNQSALAFQLSVVEVRPFVSSRRNKDAGIAWVPMARIQTEIIHRTAVTVTVQGAAEVSVDVSTDSAEQIDAASAEESSRRSWKDVLRVPATTVELTPSELWTELEDIHDEALTHDWSVIEPLVREGDSGPYLRGRSRNGYIEGRFGVNLNRLWMPSVFVGAYFFDYDHKQTPLDPDGGDFAIILDVTNKEAEFDRDAYLTHELFTELRARLASVADPWDFGDHLSDSRVNRYHPIHLRLPLTVLLEGANSPAERRERWFKTARAGLGRLMSGGELEKLATVFSTTE